MNEYLAIWGEWGFAVPMVVLIIAVASALFFEYKYLVERGKNKQLHDFLMYINNPAMVPFNPTNTNQKSGGGNPVLVSIPKVNTSPLQTIPSMRTISDSTTLSKFIKRIISKYRKCKQLRFSRTI